MAPSRSSAASRAARCRASAEHKYLRSAQLPFCSFGLLHPASRRGSNISYRGLHPQVLAEPRTQNSRIPNHVPLHPRRPLAPRPERWPARLARPDAAGSWSGRHRSLARTRQLTAPLAALGRPEVAPEHARRSSRIRSKTPRTQHSRLGFVPADRLRRALGAHPLGHRCGVFGAGPGRAVGAHRHRDAGERAGSEPGAREILRRDRASTCRNF